VSTDSLLLDLVGCVYDAALDQTKWSESLQRTADFAGGTGAFHIVANPVTGEIVHSQSVGVDPIVNQRYLQYYAAKEVRIPPALPYSVGRVFTEQQLIEPRALKRSEIYGELLAPFDIPYVMAAWLKKGPAAFEVVVIEGSHRHGPFAHEAREKFALVVPHLIRAVRLREMLHIARQATRAFRTVLDSSPFGVVLLDDRGCILDATLKADSLLRAGDGLMVSRRRVHARCCDDDLVLQRLVSEAVGVRDPRYFGGGSVSIQRALTASRLHASIVPLSSHELAVIPEPAALLLIVDPDQSPKPHVETIAIALGLTRAEAALAAALFDGVSLREAAAAMGRSVNTCKSQLKSIYQKTNCRHHADLAKKMLMAALISQKTE